LNFLPGIAERGTQKSEDEEAEQGSSEKQFEEDGVKGRIQLSRDANNARQVKEVEQGERRYENQFRYPESPIKFHTRCPFSALFRN